jgi:hypothetical protein
MEPIKQFLAEDGKVVMVGPYPVPREIIKKGKVATQGYISKMKKKRKLIGKSTK